MKRCPSSLYFTASITQVNSARGSLEAYSSGKHLEVFHSGSSNLFHGDFWLEHTLELLTPLETGREVPVTDVHPAEVREGTGRCFGMIRGTLPAYKQKKWSFLLTLSMIICLFCATRSWRCCSSRSAFFFRRVGVVFALSSSSVNTGSCGIRNRKVEDKRWNERKDTKCCGRDYSQCCCVGGARGVAGPHSNLVWSVCT